VTLAGKKTQEILTATDSIIEALDMAVAELKRIAEHQVSFPSLELGNWMWRVIRA